MTGAATGYAGKPLTGQVTGAYGQALQGASDAQGMGADPSKLQLGTTPMQPYMNPFTKNVTQSTIGELDRQEALQGNRLQDQATQQNAFGGDRFAIQQAANNRDYDVTRANAIGGLNKDNFAQAQQGAMFDVNNRISMAGQGQNQLGQLANMGFGWGDSLQKNNLLAGSMQTQQQQQIADAIKAQFGGYTGQGNTGLDTFLNSIGIGKPNNTSTEKAGSPGLLGILGSILPMLGGL
jgi:hypothetical protein